MKRLLLLTLVGAVLLYAAPALSDGDFYVVAAGGGVGTKIASLPCTITTPGFYYLAKDLTMTASFGPPDSGIKVDVDNVTIDLMGFSLACSGSGDQIGIVIPGRKNVEVRNGTVSGFPAGGIYGSGGNNYRFINLRLEKNGIWGINVSTGYYHLIQNCNASENGNTGIAAGYGCKVIGNISCKNGLRGIACEEGSSLLGNVVADNNTHGFYLSLTAGKYYLIDGNTAYNNTSGTLNGIPPNAKFGVNAGPGFP